MANAHLRECASQSSETTARRHLAPNVTCMFTEDRPPVVNPPRRGRYPRGVVNLRAFPARYYPGALCELRSPSNPDGVPVRIEYREDDGRYSVEALAGYQVILPDGEACTYALADQSLLFRTAVVSIRYAQEVRRV